MRVGRISRLLKLSHECLPVTDLLKSGLRYGATPRERVNSPNASDERWRCAEPGCVTQRHAASLCHPGDHSGLAMPPPIRRETAQVVPAAAPPRTHVIA